MRKVLARSRAIPVAAIALVGCAPEPGSPQSARKSGTDAVRWGPCADFIKDVAKTYGQLDEPSPLKGREDRMQCGEISVPMNYDEPQGGRQLTLAGSRFLPGMESAGIVLTNPGDPGIDGRPMPALIAFSGMSALTNDRTIVAIDVRGTSGSILIDCDVLDEAVPPERRSERVGCAAYAEEISKANEKCAGEDRAYFEQITTQNAARDLEQARIALGPDKVEYFGASWGTELGAAYLSAFPGSDRHLLLDSVTDLYHGTNESLDDIAQALANVPAGGTAGLQAAGIYSPLSITFPRSSDVQRVLGSSQRREFLAGSRAEGGAIRARSAGTHVASSQRGHRRNVVLRWLAAFSRTIDPAEKPAQEPLDRCPRN